MNNSFYSMLLRQKYIRRWALMRNICEENLAEHCAETAILTHALAAVGNTVFGRGYDTGKAVLFALYHDAPEVVTGDLPTPVKYFNADMRETYAEIEENAANALLSRLPEPLKAEYTPYFAEPDEDIRRLVKAADKLCAYIKCVEEEKGGNTEFRSAKATIAAAMDGMDCQELQWFRENLLPSFCLTLDEM